MRAEIASMLDGMERRPEMWAQNLGSLEDQYCTLLSLLYGDEAVRKARLRQRPGKNTTLASEDLTWPEMVECLKRIRSSLAEESRDV